MSQTVLLGAVSSLLATIAMTLIMLGLGDDDPPATAHLWQEFIAEGGAPTDYTLQALALHLIYGVSVGVMFAIGVAKLGWDEPLVLIFAGLTYGLTLAVGGAVVWLRGVLDLGLTAQVDWQYGLAHAMYGLVLGLVVAFPPV